MTILAVANPIYQPAMRIISNITNSYPAIVTTTFVHQYKTETIIRLDIAPGYGMRQANQLFGEIVVLSPTTFSIDIDTTYFDAFITPASPTQYSQSVPFGENNDTLKAATLNILNPNVPGGI